MGEHNVELGTLYDINKQIMNQQPQLSEEEIQEAKDKLKEWFKQHRYAMFLCTEQKDYTVFEKKTMISTYDAPVTELLACIKNRGQLLSIEFKADGAVEIWIKIDGDTFCYYLFDYEMGMIIY